MVIAQGWLAAGSLVGGARRGGCWRRSRNLFLAPPPRSPRRRFLYECPPTCGFGPRRSPPKQDAPPQTPQIQAEGSASVTLHTSVGLRRRSLCFAPLALWTKRSSGGRFLKPLSSEYQLSLPTARQYGEVVDRRRRPFEDSGSARSAPRRPSGDLGSDCPLTRECAPKRPYQPQPGSPRKAVRRAL